MKIELPDFAVVLLIGCSGSGKSTFAVRHFLKTEVLSSDDFRGWVADDPNTLDANEDAFTALHHVAGIRLRRRRLTVIDATNVQEGSRKALLQLARDYDALLVAIVLDLPEAVLHERNRVRTDRNLGPHVVRTQMRSLRQSQRQLRKEGLHHIYNLGSQSQVDSVEISRGPLWTDKRHETDPFDLIGDIHGCYDELVELLGKLGYVAAPVISDAPIAGLSPHPSLLPAGEKGQVVASSPAYFHPEGRRVVFLGDLVDRGPKTVEVVRLVMAMCANGSALCVPGNHDVKLKRALEGKAVNVGHGLAESLNDIERLPEEEQEAFKRDYGTFVEKLVSHLWLDGGNLVASHAGLKEEYIGRASKRIREFCLYGETTGEVDEFGLPVRLNWAASYRAKPVIAYGHVPVPEAEWLNNTIDLDTGCVFGGKLSALRWPEREIVQVAARETYAIPAKPIGYQSTRSSSDLTTELRSEWDRAIEPLRKMRDGQLKTIQQLQFKIEYAEQSEKPEIAFHLRTEVTHYEQTLHHIEASLRSTTPLSSQQIDEQRNTIKEMIAEGIQQLRLKPNADSADVQAKINALQEALFAERDVAVQVITRKNQLQNMLDQARYQLAEVRSTQAQEAAGIVGQFGAAVTDEEIAVREQNVERLRAGYEEAEEIVKKTKLKMLENEQIFRQRATSSILIKALREQLAILDRLYDITERATSGGSPVLSAQWSADELLHAEDVLGERIVETRLGGNILIPAENSAAAFEVASRYAVEPRWLIYLPPTMSPSETSTLDGFLEHPAEAFHYFREQGVERVVCQTKHMGSRAVVVLCRDAEIARQRFGASGAIGELYTRTGRRFFDDEAMHREFLARLQSECTRTGLWEALSSDWVCLDAELMPWNAKAKGLIREQYAPVGAAALAATEATKKATEAALARQDLSTESRDILAAVAERAAGRHGSAARYVAAYRRYCWPVGGLDDLRIAPFHVLAWEGHTGFDRDHRWHLETLGKLAEESSLVTATDSREVELADEASCQAATEWWLERTGEGSEGMVVKPMEFIARGKHGMVQPALKVRGQEYLRIIYGPEYDEPANLVRLRKRGLGGKRRLASKEFILGVEGLERFVRREPLRRVHECALGVLAMESEPVDPRL
jgi:predicted kinase/diadenosine tetraphosphatase ApaH/serine/threonine PP2A family protein phosphatase